MNCSLVWIFFLAMIMICTLEVFESLDVEALMLINLGCGSTPMAKSRKI